VARIYKEQKALFYPPGVSGRGECFSHAQRRLNDAHSTCRASEMELTECRMRNCPKT